MAPQDVGEAVEDLVSDLVVTRSMLSGDEERHVHIALGARAAAGVTAVKVGKGQALEPLQGCRHSLQCRFIHFTLRIDRSSAIGNELHSCPRCAGDSRDSMPACFRLSASSPSRSSRSPEAMPTAVLRAHPLQEELGAFRNGITPSPHSPHSRSYTTLRVGAAVASWRCLRKALTSTGSLPAATRGGGVRGTRERMPPWADRSRHPTGEGRVPAQR